MSLADIPGKLKTMIQVLSSFTSLVKKTKNEMGGQQRLNMNIDATSRWSKFFSRGQKTAL